MAKQLNLLFVLESLVYIVELVKIVRKKKLGFGIVHLRFLSTEHCIDSLYAFKPIRLSDHYIDFHFCIILDHLSSSLHPVVQNFIANKKTFYIPAIVLSVHQLCAGNLISCNSSLG